LEISEIKGLGLIFAFYLLPFTLCVALFPSILGYLMSLVTLENFLDNTSFLILFLTMLIYWAGSLFPNLSYLPILGTTGVGVANLSIAGLLLARWIEAGYFPISNLYESLFFLAWGVTAAHLIAERISRSSLVGVATTPVAMGITAFATLTLPKEMQSSSPLVPALKSNWLMMHVSVMMLSYAALMVGSLLAIAFLIITQGKTVELKGSSVGTGAYRLRRQSDTSETKLTPQMAAISTVEELNNAGGVAVLENIKTEETQPLELFNSSTVEIAAI
jgi:ABC-type transport system involved in cytochrome c biogenesis permease subunit